MPKLGKGEKSRKIWDFYAYPDSGRLRSGLFYSGKVRGASALPCNSVTFTSFSTNSKRLKFAPMRPSSLRSGKVMCS